MKELKTYISEGFFNNVGANNKIKLAIDTIKDASLNDKINTKDQILKFRELLTSILEGVETDMKKGKFVFEYIRRDAIRRSMNKTTISLEISESNKAVWIYDNESGESEYDVSTIAFNIAMDLYYEFSKPTKKLNLRHSIANTIKVIEFKVS